MGLSPKDIAIKYHRYNDEEWANCGCNTIELIEAVYKLNGVQFLSSNELSLLLKASSITDILIVHDNTIETTFIAEVLDSCKQKGMNKIAIKNTYGYGE